ncbi:hypothetical protein [Alkalibacillus silvisoli]|uniref:DNA primase n=1 Tax=Alkalibacillus silvisoli TaxID=392823 RepID=A0ABN1A619_9BACI
MNTQFWKLCMVMLMTFALVVGCGTTDDDDYNDPGIDAPEEESDMQQSEEFDDENPGDDEEPMQDEFDDEYDPEDNEDETDNY